MLDTTSGNSYKSSVTTQSSDSDNYSDASSYNPYLGETTSDNSDDSTSSTSYSYNYDDITARIMQTLALDKSYSQTNVNSNYTVYDAYEDTMNNTDNTDNTNHHDYGYDNSYDHSGGGFFTGTNHGAEASLDIIDVGLDVVADLGEQIGKFGVTIATETPKIANAAGNIVKGCVDVCAQGLITCATLCCAVPLGLLGLGLNHGAEHTRKLIRGDRSHPEVPASLSTDWASIISSSDDE